MDDRVEWIDFAFRCGHFRRQQLGYLPQWVPHHIHTITLGDKIIPLARSNVSPPRTNDLTRPPVAATAKLFSFFFNQEHEEP